MRLVREAQLRRNRAHGFPRFHQRALRRLHRDATPHGIADARFLRGLLDWMAKQKLGESDQPLVLRIPELSDAQIRAAARSLDPFAVSDGSATRPAP